MESFNSSELIHTLGSILNIGQSISGIAYLKDLVRNIAQTFGFKYVFVGHAIGPGLESVQTDAVWAGGGYHDNFIYKLKGTPCENVLSGNRVCVYAKDVADIFPEDKLLVEMGVESYIGSPILTGKGELSSLIVILDDKPVEAPVFFSVAIDFFAARVGAELERYHIEEDLRCMVSEKTTELERTNQELKIALSEIKTLHGIIPICANCKKIRDDQGFWHQMESYITKRTEANFSHGICPECVRRLYPGLGDSNQMNGDHKNPLPYKEKKQKGE